MKISCIIIDDEPLARKGLREYISDVEDLELAGEFDNALSAASLIASGSVQLLFLDIQLPKITGLDFFKTLTQAPPVIFTTAYPQYALEGYEVNALDYLVKPISFERFLKAVQKAREYYEWRQLQTSPADAADYFYVKADNKLVKIAYQDVLFIEALQNYVVIHTPDRKFMTYLTFRSVEEYLPTSLFCKVHKSYIVSMAKIDSIEGNDIKIGAHHIPISRNLREEVMDRLLKNRFLRR